MNIFRKHWSKGKRAILCHVLAALAWICLLWLFYFSFGKHLIERMYRGESLEFLNQLVEHRLASHGFRPVESFQFYARLLLSRVTLVGLAVHLLAVLFVWRRKALTILKKFFTAETHPLNLAIFRIVFFWTFLNETELAKVSWFSQLPPELRTAPWGMHWVIGWLPIGESSVAICKSLLLLFCFTGMIGLFSRTSALLTTVLGFYVLSVPQLFGKVNHYHHFVWFSALLAVSGGGDFLSFDAIIGSWRKADCGITSPPRSSAVYTLTLCFVQLLLGVIYFFPGFWKLWTAGYDWILGENLRFQMYSKWMEFGGWTPRLRIDLYPAICKMGALLTVCFEISFIFLIFFPMARLFLPFAGVAFHKMTDLFMRIFFLDLIKFYVVLFNWHHIFRYLGQRLFEANMYVIYDGDNKVASRMVASLRVLDILGRVEYLNRRCTKQGEREWLSELEAGVSPDKVHAVVGNHSWKGYKAWRVITGRMPVLWPVLPLLYLWPISRILQTVYRRAASMVVYHPWLRTSQLYQPNRLPTGRGLRWNVLVGQFLLVINLICGFRGIVNGWPFSCYPTFATLMEKPHGFTLEVEALDARGQIIEWDDGRLGEQFSSERFRGLLNRILETKDSRQLEQRLRALWRVSSRDRPDLENVKSIRFYRLALTTVPEQQRENPLERKLLYQFTP